MVHDIWLEFLKIVKEEAGSRVVETWFKAVSLQQWDQHNKLVYLQAPNAFVQDWIKSNYVPLIELHLKRLLNVDQVAKLLLARKQQKLKWPILLPICTEPPCMLQQKKQCCLQNRCSKKKKPEGIGQYSFDSFVVGPIIHLPMRRLKRWQKSRGLFIIHYLFMVIQALGKTHLFMPLAPNLKNIHKKAMTLYQTADRFVNEFINAIRFDKVHQFQSKYKELMCC